MATEIRPELSEKNPYWIGKHRYYELKHFCLQYPIWKKAYNALLGLSSRPNDLDIFVKSGQVRSDPTARCAESRVSFAKRMELVEQAAIGTDGDLYTYHYEDKDWDLFHCKEVATAPEWDGHTDKDVERVLSLSDDESDWAAREVALASKKERESSEDKDDWDYGVACYESALRAYRSLERDGHSGMSIQITKSILNRLIDGKCLTPIEDDPDIWTKVEFGENDPIQHFQCKRMSSLFKDVAEDGTAVISTSRSRNTIAMYGNFLLVYFSIFSVMKRKAMPTSTTMLPLMLRRTYSEIDYA